MTPSYCYTNRLLFLLGVYYDITSSDHLIHAIIVNYHFRPIFTVPNLNAECVRITVSCPEHELILTCTIYCSCAFKLCSCSTHVDNQPLITAAVEVQIAIQEIST